MVWCSAMIARSESRVLNSAPSIARDSSDGISVKYLRTGALTYPRSPPSMPKCRRLGRVSANSFFRVWVSGSLRCRASFTINALL